MKMTIGRLVSELFDRYQRQYRDEELAALATQVVMSEVLAARQREGAPGPRGHGLRRAA